METPYGDIPAIPDNPATRTAMAAKSYPALIARELLFFKVCDGIPGYEGPGRFAHATTLCNALWRQKGHEVFKWHPWLEDTLEEYCRTNEVIVTGPASGGKTTGAALFANLFWLCSTEDTGVILTSTTRDGLKKRIWSETRNFYTNARKIIGDTGRLVDSDLCIQSYKGATKHGIYGIAVAQGEEQKALGRIIGFHPRRIFVAVDELTDVSWAIIEALTNLFTAKQKAQFTGIGNAALIFDSHGKMAEPKDGWNSVNVESDRWATKRGGICLHFDGFKCENVVKGQKIYPFLLTKEDIDKTADEYGMDSPQMYRFRRGFWCPEGTTKTVLNDSLIQKFMAMTKAIWEGPTQMWAGLDPAFEGGDRCILRFGKTGKSDNGLDTLELGESVCIKTDVTLKEPLHYQIARQVKEECTRRGVTPDHFGMDVTGEGGGLASILSEEWGPGFHQVEFGGRPSDLPVSDINAKSCRDEYYDKVTELWYSFRTILMRNQIRGLDPEAAMEFCKRLYTVDGKIWIESKKEMKARPGNRSPDLADGACVLADVVRHRGGLGKILSKAQSAREAEWNKLSREYAESDDDAFMTDGIEALV
jgi:hypothetical protein